MKFIRRSFRHARLAALRPLLDRLAAIDAHAAGLGQRLSSVERTLERLAEATEMHTGWTLEREKHREELSYWRWVIETQHERKAIPEGFEGSFGRWQRERLRELGLGLDLLKRPGGNKLWPVDKGFVTLPEEELARLDPAVDAWCAEQSVVEIGAGPYPAIAAAPRWKRAVAVDPLARGYSEEKMLPRAAAHVVYIEAPGERVPLPAAFADLVIIENMLDHASRPESVLRECVRLLREGGLLWILVDLSRYTDPMHPQPLDEPRLRGLLGDAGLVVVTERVSDHHSHPKAYGEYRGLLRKRLADAQPRITPAGG